MLKWTVSKRGGDCAATNQTETTATTTTTTDGSEDHTYFVEPCSVSRPMVGRHPRDHRRRSRENCAPMPQIATPRPLTKRHLIATSTPYGSQEVLAATISSASATPSPLRKRSQQAAFAGRVPAGSTLPTFGVEYSPMQLQRSGQAIALRGLTIPDSFFGSARYFPPAAAQPADVPDAQPAQKRRKVTATDYLDEEATLNCSSKALDDAELSRMIDDILQSKRKPSVAASRTTSATRSKLLSPLLDEDFAFIAHKPILPAATLQHSPPSEQGKQLATLISEHPYLRESIELLAGLSTPKDLRPATDAEAQPLRMRSTTSAASSARSPVEGLATDAADAGPTTIANGPAEQIRRCLLFPESPESRDRWLKKRQSVASTISSTSSRCSSKSATAPVSGALSLAIRMQDAKIEVHVIRCKGLRRSSADGPINAYVKVARLAAGQTTPDQTGGFQRTRVHRDSAEPFFNHRFLLDNAAAAATGTGTDAERIQLTVWHRDRESKRSEFLGCLAFPVDAVFGVFQLQPQLFLTSLGPTPTEPVRPDSAEAAADEELELPRTDGHPMQMTNRQAADILSYLDSQTAQRSTTSDAAYKQSLCVG